MIDKRTVFVLGAGASCPYGYPSGSELRRLICYNAGSLYGGFRNSYLNYLSNSKFDQSTKDAKRKDIKRFIEAFDGANTETIDAFMANNSNDSTLVNTGKYIIAFEIFRAERESCFGEELKRKREELEDAQQDITRKKAIRGQSGFQGEDWYIFLYRKIIKGLIGKGTLPDFSDDKISFITFNYDRSLEHFFYDSLRHLYSEVTEDRIVQILKQLKILHVYGQTASLRWQNPNDYVEYKPQINESLLQNAASNIRTMHEEEENPELIEAQNLLKQAEQIFILGFGYAPENMEVLSLPNLIPPGCEVYGTAFGIMPKEVKDILHTVRSGRKADSDGHKERYDTTIEPCDCLMLLRKYL